MEIVQVGAWLAVFVHLCQTAHFRVRPSDAVVTTGQPATLQCVVDDEYQKGRQHVYWAWTGPRNQQMFLSVDRTFYTGVSDDKRSRYNIAGNVVDGEFNLHISSTVANDEGEYRCILYDSAGKSQRASARLLVQEARPPAEGYPRCSVSPSVPQPGGYATFACVSAGGVPPATLSWYRRGMDIVGPIHRNSTGDQTGVYLRRLLTGWDNNVTFTCVSESSETAERYGSCSVVPFEIPTHVTVLPSQMMTGGDTAEFFCLATSLPSSIRYRWLLGRGKNLVRTTKTTGRFLVANEGATLRILNVTSEDNDMPVRCVARNALDIKGFDEVLLRVGGADRLTVTDPYIMTTATSAVTTAQAVTTNTAVFPTAEPRTIAKTAHPDPPAPILTTEWVNTRLRLGDAVTKHDELKPSVQTTERNTSSLTHGITSPPPSPPDKTSPPLGPSAAVKKEFITATSPVSTDDQAPTDSVHTPGTKATDEGSSVAAAIGFTILVIVVLILIGILVKIKVDDHKKPVHKKNLRPQIKTPIDKLDIVVLPNATAAGPAAGAGKTDQGNKLDTTDEQTGGNNQTTPATKTKRGSIRSLKISRRRSYVHPDFLEQLASTIRSRSHGSSMFKRSSFSWRKKKTPAVADVSNAPEEPTDKIDESVATEREVTTSTVKRYSAFFNAVPAVQVDEHPIPAPRQVDKSESVYENTEIGLVVQKQRQETMSAVKNKKQSLDRESHYENTPCFLRRGDGKASPRRETEYRKSEASSLLNLVYADLDWTGFQPKKDEVHEEDNKTEYASIRLSKEL